MMISLLASSISFGDSLYNYGTNLLPDLLIWLFVLVPTSDCLSVNGIIIHKLRHAAHVCNPEFPKFTGAKLF
jgi:hypothetical protein